MNELNHGSIVLVDFSYSNQPSQNYDRHLSSVILQITAYPVM